MNEKKAEKNIIAGESLKAISEIEDSLKMEHIVKDNKIEFKVGELSYRVRKPSLTEVEELNLIRRKKRIEFIDDDTYLFRKQWKEKYKKKGIDIDKMELEVKTIQNEIEVLLLRLAKTSEPKSIAILQKSISELREKQYTLSIEQTDLLSCSIEDQLLVYVNSYTTYLVLEKKDKENWTRVFDSYEDFLQTENKDLLVGAYTYINHLIYEEDYEPKSNKKIS